MAMKASRTQVWLESLGDWSWPGQGGAAVEFLPPPWVPALPAAAGAGLRRRGRAALAAARARAGRAGCSTARCWARSRVDLRRARAGRAADARAASIGADERGGDRAGSAGDQLRAGGCSRCRRSSRSARTRPAARSLRAGYPSRGAARQKARSSCTCPRATRAPTLHYPVLYMLPGDDQSDTAFLQIGLQAQLDRLIAAHAIPPMIAVMIQGGPGANLWRNQGALALRKLHPRSPGTDRPDAADGARARRARGRRRLDGRLRRDERRARQPLPLRRRRELAQLLQRPGRRPARRPADHRAARAARVRLRRRTGPHRQPRRGPAVRRGAAGAPARTPRGAIYPGEHNLETIEAHLESMLCSPGARCEQPTRCATGAAWSRRTGAGSLGALAGGAAARAAVRSRSAGSRSARAIARSTRRSVAPERGELVVERAETPPSRPLRGAPRRAQRESAEYALAA